MQRTCPKQAIGLEPQRSRARPAARWPLPRNRCRPEERRLLFQNGQLRGWSAPLPAAAADTPDRSRTTAHRRETLLNAEHRVALDWRWEGERKPLLAGAGIRQGLPRCRALM